MSDSELSKAGEQDVRRRRASRFSRDYGEFSSTSYRLFSAAGRASPAIAAGAAIGFALGLAGVVAWRMAVPRVTVYRAALTVSLAKNEEVSDNIVTGLNNPKEEKPNKTYPNGAQFSPNDLMSPDVLDEVWKSNKLEEYGLSRDDFAEMVSVQPYSPVVDSVNERYAARMANRNLSFQERLAIEKEYAAELESLSGERIAVGLVIPENVAIPELVAAKVVTDVPAKWASIFISRYGVTSLPVASSKAVLADGGALELLDYPAILDYIEDRAEMIDRQIAEVEKFPGATSYSLPGSGRGVSDLKRDFELFRQSVIGRVMRPLVEAGLAKDRAAARLTYESAIARAAAEARAAEERARSFVDAITVFDRANVVSAGAQPNLTPQVDSTFLDRIISLSARSASGKYREDLIRGKLLADTDREMALERSDRLKRRLDGMSRDIPPDLPLDSDRYTAAAKQSVAQLNSFWIEINEVLSGFSASRLNHDKTLYRPGDFGKEFRRTKSPFLDRYSWTTLFGATLFGALAGFGSFIVSRLRRRYAARALR